MAVLTAAVVVLAIATLINLLLLFAVVRRLRRVQELAVPPVPLPWVGTFVAPFRVEAADGPSWTTPR